MEEKQQEELVYIEGIQRTQFEEFTQAWDDYMAQYEQAAFESIEKLKLDHYQEILALRASYGQSPKEKFTISKKLVQFRNMEKKSFIQKNYDGATYFKYLADELEQLEREAHQDKILERFEKQERIYRKKQETFMINFLRRVQRDRDEQLLHRQHDSKILIQRNKNMLRDMGKRH